MPALLFPPGDVDAGSRVLVRLSEDPALRRRLGDRLRQRQQRMFSIGQHLDGLEALYGQVMAESPGERTVVEAARRDRGPR